MSIKDELEELIARLDQERATTALAYLRWLVREQTLERTLATAPLDDEPETAEEQAAVAEAKAELARGEAIPADEVFRRFGL